MCQRWRLECESVSSREQRADVTSAAPTAASTCHCDRTGSTAKVAVPAAGWHLRHRLRYQARQHHVINRRGRFCGA